ncbi:MAG: DnaJ domain-containing protein [Armatimonadetes bacterium]|nr:DnaJ domain-containing protein [Armatimonadota bacterium]
MPEPTFYETLGLTSGASAEDVKRAYRRLARKLHPDVNSNPGALEEFHRVQEAYEALSDPRRKDAYDAILRVRANREQATAKAQKARLEEEDLKRRAEARMSDAPAAPRIDLAETRRLTGLLNSGRLVEAERLAKTMVQVEPRQPVPHAVLGDIARIRGDIETALRHYGYAAQHEPRNPAYQRKYEEMMSAQPVTADRRASAKYVPDVAVQPLLVGAFLVVTMAIYVALAPERPLGLSFASKWALGTMVMLFLGGVVSGACLSLSKALAQFDATAGSAMMKVPPAVALGLLSIFSFWLSCVLYMVVGQTQQAFNRSLSLLLGTVVALVGVFALAGLAKGPELAVQNLLWGGNLLYMGAVFGWFVTDSLRPR